MQTAIDGGLLNYVWMSSRTINTQPEEILPDWPSERDDQKGWRYPDLISEFGGWGDRSTAKMERALTLLRATHSGASYFALRARPKRG